MFSKDEIRMGDTVKLNDGTTLIVDSVFDSYTDRAGQHEGPFVASRDVMRSTHLLAEVAEIVARNERLCVYCGNGVTSSNPDVDFCRNCHYTGVAHEHRRGKLLADLEVLPNVKSASVWHTGGGCFMLAVTLTDDRLLTITDGDASLPEGDETWRWLAVWKDEPTYSDFEWGNEEIDENEEERSDDQLVAYIATL